MCEYTATTLEVLHEEASVVRSFVELEAHLDQAIVSRFVSSCNLLSDSDLVSLENSDRVGHEENIGILGWGLFPQSVGSYCFPSKCETYPIFIIQPLHEHSQPIL
jgi:hypothetical protein